MAEEHKQQHRTNARFASRHSITAAGMNCGRDCAIATALGILEGAIDELVIMQGERAAYESVMKLADSINVAKAGAEKI